MRKKTYIKTKIFFLFFLTFSFFGCTTLIIKDDDNAGEISAKVFTRVILGIPTLSLSEVGMGWAKEEYRIDKIDETNKKEYQRIMDVEQTLISKYPKWTSDDEREILQWKRDMRLWAMANYQVSLDRLALAGKKLSFWSSMSKSMQANRYQPLPQQNPNFSFSAEQKIDEMYKCYKWNICY